MVLSRNFRIGQLCFINTRPIYYDMQSHSRQEIGMVQRTPSVLNQMLHEGEIDLSVVSAAEYALHCSEYFLVPSLSVGSWGKVESVCWYSRLPFPELHRKKFLVTEDSLTSVWLSAILFQKVWSISPCFERGKIQPCDLENRDVAGFLSIGDRALTLRQNPPADFPYCLDLGEAWQEWTGKPFVFAVWALRKDSFQNFPSLSHQAIDMLYQSKKKGLESLSEIARQAARDLALPYEICLSYFRNLHYDLAPEYVDGMKVFFECLYQHGYIPNPVEMQQITDL